MIDGKLLSRDEISEIWQIDRSELIEAVYSVVNGTFILKPEHHDVKGWPPGEAERYTPILQACCDRGGWLYGLFDNRKPVGVAVLEGRFMGKDKDQLQLKFLHVSSKCRDKGFGKRLFVLAATEASTRGAKSLYISATPSEHTVNFYLRLGCKVASEPDPELFELEPEDIHLEYDLRKSRGGGMSHYTAVITWERKGAMFTDNRYSRAHRWKFDGGIEVPASASPQVVPLPLSVAEAVDPEEAFVAALASCHMLWFLSIAAKQGFVVESYRDEASGVMAKNADGKLAMTQVTLRPHLVFAGAKRPSAAQHESMHHKAHELCFIASSVKTDVRCEAVDLTA